MMEKIDTEILVSIIIPLMNEEKYIDRCIQSIISQDYPLANMEVIFVDGQSNDDSTKIIDRYIQQYKGKVKLFENNNKTVPYAMNIGIKNSKGKYIVRLDAHSEYPNNYITSCISALERTNSDNAGGLAITKGYGLIGESFSTVLSSKFGVGNSGFRTNAMSGYVDTVPFGTFKRETFSKYGLYDERLTRNQDYELNYRIRKNGGRIYLDSTIKLIYYCRNTVPGILKQSYENGKWNVITYKLCPGSMSLRHFIPLLFLLSLLAFPVLSMISPLFLLIFEFELLLYFFLDIIYSFKSRVRTQIKLALIILFPTFHISYGFGSLVGLVSNIKKV